MYACTNVTGLFDVSDCIVMHSLLQMGEVDALVTKWTTGANRGQQATLKLEVF